MSDSDPSKKTVMVKQDDPNLDPVPTVVIDEGATHFTLGVLDVFLMGTIYDKSTKVTRVVSEETQEAEMTLGTQVNATNIEAVRFGLRGWSNFKDAKGNDIAFPTVKKFVHGRSYQVLTDEGLNVLGIRLIQELGQKIKAISEVSTAEAKNSVAAS